MPVSIILLRNPDNSPVMVAHAFYPSTRETEEDFCEFEASVVYRTSSRIARDTQRTLSQKTKTKKPKKTNKQNKTNQKKPPLPRNADNEI